MAIYPFMARINEPLANGNCQILNDSRNDPAWVVSGAGDRMAPERGDWEIRKPFDGVGRENDRVARDGEFILEKKKKGTTGRYSRFEYKILDYLICIPSDWTLYMTRNTACGRAYIRLRHILTRTATSIL
jgi:hypothetical protein